MTQIEWRPLAELFLLGAPPTDAEAIVAAMEAFALERRGFVRQMLDARGTLALYAGPYVINFVFLDAAHIAVLDVQERKR